MSNSPKRYRPSEVWSILVDTVDNQPALQRALEDGGTLKRAFEESISGAEMEGETVLEDLIDLIAGFIRSYPASPHIRQKLWDCCDSWIKEISGALHCEYDENAFENECPKPVTNDTGIELIKALHDAQGKTKEELSGEIGVGEKTVQTDLRALCPELSRDGSQPAPPIRIGGQLVRVQVKEAHQSGKKTYATPNRLHPIVLQLNTMQLGTLLQALQEKNDAQNSIVCKDLATDIWLQLSDCGKERIFEIFGAHDPDMMAFLQDTEEEAEEIHEQYSPFIMESEMVSDLSCEEQLLCAYKGDSRCSLTVKINGQRTVLQNVRIADGCNGGQSWVAYPDGETPDSANAVRFAAQDVCGFLTF